MSRAVFTFYKVELKKTTGAHSVCVEGDITNNSTRDYNTAVFRVSLFQKNVILWTGTLKMNNFKRNQTKSFNFFLEGFDYSKLPFVSRHDIYFESGY